MLVGYEYSDSEDSNEEKNDNKKTSNNSNQQDGNIKEKQTNNLKEKFAVLQKRREIMQHNNERVEGTSKMVDSNMLEEEPLKVDVDSATTSSGNRKLTSAGRKRKNILHKTMTSKIRRRKYEKINEFMPSVFHVTTDYDPYLLNKSKLEEEIDRAIQNKDFKLATELSDAKVKRDFQQRVNKAETAMKYQEKQKNKEEKKQRRRKLKWSSNHKQRWETKGNM